MFVSQAFAQSAGGGDLFGGGMMQIAPLILIFVVFYFLLIRPQQKKAKAHRELLAALRRGDRVVTAGGLIGTIAKVLNDKELQVEIADGVRVRVLRGMVSDVLARPEPADDEDSGEDEEKDDKSEKKKVASGR